MSEELQKGTTISHYEILSSIGKGGMGEVFLAEDTKLNRKVALKILPKEFAADIDRMNRFVREAKSASALNHPNIITIYEIGESEGTHFIATEFIDGKTLTDYAKANRHDDKTILEIAVQVASALQTAHVAGIVHRDIKPDNIFLVNQSGIRLHVRVLDFGIARIYRDDTGPLHEQLTSPGAAIGTPRYMSPEQLAGQQVDARSDIYSAAMVIHECLTRELPYVRGKLCDLCPEATDSLQELLDQCLRPNPAERPPSAVEVYLRLQELGKASGILLLPPGAMDRLIAARQSESMQPTVAYDPGAILRKRLRIALALAALGAAGLWWFFRP
jgi:eukaryotic-like serine/threonine-protein kinase